MKNLLMGAIILFLFSISILVIQTSCSKSKAQTNSSASQLNKIVYAVNFGTPNTQIWTANYDGTNATQVPLVLPTNISIDKNASYFALKISPDGQTIFFSAYDTSNPNYTPSIYSCNISGGSVLEVIPGSVGSPRLGQPY